jgi:hypothetical protein
LLEVIIIVYAPVPVKPIDFEPVARLSEAQKVHLRAIFIHTQFENYTFVGKQLGIDLTESEDYPSKLGVDHDFARIFQCIAGSMIMKSVAYGCTKKTPVSLAYLIELVHGFGIESSLKRPPDSILGSRLQGGKIYPTLILTNPGGEIRDHRIQKK